VAHRPVPSGALMYIATPDRNKNVNWLGEASVNDMAVQIANAHGPSGPNDAYLFHIADDMRKVPPHSAWTTHLNKPSEFNIPPLTDLTNAQLFA
jgi:cation transport regulator ChaC